MKVNDREETTNGIKKIFFLVAVLLFLGLEPVIASAGEAAGPAGSSKPADSAVKLLKDGSAAYYPTFETAVTQLNNFNIAGYELQLLKDITITGNIVLPQVSFTLSGAKEDGGEYTLTVNNGNFIPKSDITLKNIKLARTGGGGNFYAYDFYSQLTVNIQEDVFLENLDVVGSKNKDSVLNVLSDIDLGNRSILDVRNVFLGNGCTLKTKSLVATNLTVSNAGKIISDTVTAADLSLNDKSSLAATNLSLMNLSMNNGSILKVAGSGGLAIGGSLTGSGQDNILALPQPLEHNGIVYSLKFADSAVISGEPIKIQPIEGVTFSSGCRLIYLGSNNGITADSFIFNNPDLVFAPRNLEDKQYLTLLEATSLCLSGRVSSIIYGDTTLLAATVTDSKNAAVPGGNVQFYRGLSPKEENLLAEVNLDSNGKAEWPLAAGELAAARDFRFCALYVDGGNLYDSSCAVTSVTVTTKSLSIGEVKVSDKVYDGTTVATVTALNLSGVINGDDVTAGATAVFTSSAVGAGKDVNLFNITLSGRDAAKYTIVPEVLGFPTTAKITRRTPNISLQATSALDEASGYTIKLSANISGAENGVIPTGSVTFSNGTDVLGIVGVHDGEAIFLWNNVPAGTYNLTAEFSGDTNYASIADGMQVVVEGAPPSSVKEIISFSLLEQTGPAVIGDGFVEIQVASGTDITALVPIIQVSENAVLSPEAGVVRDFTNPVTYTVTAEDGSTKNWQVTVSLSPEIKMTVSPPAVTERKSFAQTFILTIFQDTVAEAVYARDITLAGDFANLNIGSVIRENPTTVATAVYGDLSAVTGSGIIFLDSAALVKSRSSLSTRITVAPRVIPVESIQLTAPATTVREGRTLQMAAAVVPENAHDKSVAWSVSKVTGSATINQTGLLTGISPGTVIVEAEAHDGSGVKGGLIITVKDGGRDSDDRRSNTGNRESNAKDKYDKVIREAIKHNSNAILFLEDADNSQVQITPRLVEELAAKNKSLLVENQGITIEFPPQSLLTTQLRAASGEEAAKLELGVRKISAAEKQQLLAQGQWRERAVLFDIGGQVFELTTRIVDKAGKVTRMNRFTEPVVVIIDLSSLNSAVEMENLTGIRYHRDKQGNLVPVRLGGSYDGETKAITFSTDRFGLYSVVKAKKLTTISLAVGSLHSVVNGQEIINDIAPMLINNKTMVPLRFIAENMGADISWIEKEGKIIIALAGKILEFIIERPLPNYNQPAVIINGRTLVPLRSIAELLDSQVQWFPRQRKIYIVR